MKHIIKLFAVAMLFIGFQKNIQAQCEVTATAYPAEVCAGGTVFLTSYGSCGYLMNNDFNNNLIGTGWSSTAANPVFTNPCGPGPFGAHLWVGATSSQQRTLVTNGYDVSIGGCTIRWDMRYGLVPGAGPCEDPDATNEGVHMQYSTNGTTWTDFPGPNLSPVGPNTTTAPFSTTVSGSGGYWTPISNGSTQLTSSLYHWHAYECTVPAVASTVNTQFRWAQLMTSSTGYDAWGIDEVEITCPNSSINVLWSNGSTVFNPGQVTLPPHPQNLAYDTCFIVHIWDSINPGGAYDTVCIHVSPIPTSDFVISDTNICEYDSAHIAYTGTAPSTANFTWELNGQVFNDPGPFDSLFSTNVYVYKLTVNQDGCISSKTTHTLHVNPAPNIAFGADIISGCAPLPVNFSNFSSPPGSTYHWFFGDGDTAYATEPSHTYIQTGVFDITLEAITDQGCVDSLTIPGLINVYPNPVAQFTANPAVTNIDNPTIQFNDLSTNGFTWNWNFGDGGTSTSTSPSHTYNSDGTFTTWLIVTTDKGCVDSISYNVRVIIDNIVVPNVITPNGDGANEYFVIENIDKLESSTLLIYNRWGKKVYESNNYQNDWNGDGAADGVYYYVLKYATFFDEFEVKGTLTIIR